jgi:hypothetical protein
MSNDSVCSTAPLWMLNGENCVCIRTLHNFPTALLHCAPSYYIDFIPTQLLQYFWYRVPVYLEKNLQFTFRSKCWHTMSPQIS